MTAAPWPLADREDIAQSFRPGAALSEAPFRTLRDHGWATCGVSVFLRKGNRSCGRRSIFSALNVDAARCARVGDKRSASKLAKAAKLVEETDAFSRLTALLRGNEPDKVAAVMNGHIADPKLRELAAVVREVAVATEKYRVRCGHSAQVSNTLVGRVRERRSDVLIVDLQDGVRTAIPRWLGRSAHRENIGDYLALFEEKFADAQMVVKAVPAIELEPQSAAAFTPFGRNAPVTSLTDEDVRLLSRDPEPLKVIVPVVISG